VKIKPEKNNTKILTDGANPALDRGVSKVDALETQNSKARGLRKYSAIYDRVEAERTMTQLKDLGGSFAVVGAAGGPGRA